MNNYVSHVLCTTILFSLSICCTGCSQHQKRIKKKVTIPQRLPVQYQATTSSFKNNPPPITIWVHGTRFLRRPIFKNFFENKPGIKAVLLLDKSYYLRVLANTLSERNPDLFPIETFYLFGWSGKLNAFDRMQAAHYLAHDLIQLIKNYEEIYHTRPLIRIIAHSHGGNVVLNLASLPAVRDLNIDEIIFLAVPVQEKTQNLIRSSLFNHVYVLYSTLDFIQIIAPQIIPQHIHDQQGNIKYQYKVPFPSSRRFVSAPNIAQVGIKMNNRALLHTEFTSPYFICILPEILAIIDAWYLEEPNHDFERLLCIHSYPRTSRTTKT